MAFPLLLFGVLMRDGAFDPADPKTVYATYPNGGVLKATDGGVTGNNSFADVTPPYVGNEALLFYSPLVMDPANAKILYAGTSTLWRTVDGAATVSTTATRIFESPTLETGKAYSYNLKAEFARDGKSVVVAKKVRITAGSTVNVSMFEAAAVASR